jgi:hypothetical protein
MEHNGNSNHITPPAAENDLRSLSASELEFVIGGSGYYGDGAQDR